MPKTREELDEEIRGAKLLIKGYKAQGKKYGAENFARELRAEETILAKAQKAKNALPKAPSMFGNLLSKVQKSKQTSKQTSKKTSGFGKLKALASKHGGRRHKTTSLRPGHREWDFD
jgi:hypothetical protein